MQAAENDLRDATQLNYDYRNPFVVCVATYTTGARRMSLALLGATHFVPSQQEQLSTICDLHL